MTEWAQPRNREAYSQWLHSPDRITKGLRYLVLVLLLPVVPVRGRSGVSLNRIASDSEFFLLIDVISFRVMRVPVRLFRGGFVLVRIRTVLMALLLVRV